MSSKECGDNPDGKLSIHKVMKPKGEWQGLVPGHTIYNGTDVATQAALVVDETGWPTHVIQPTRFRPETPYPVDLTNVLPNGFSREHTLSHEPIQTVADLTTGSEVEVTILGGKISQEMHDRVKELCDQYIGSGYSTNEVRDDMIEGNRPVVHATFADVVHAARLQNAILVRVAEERGVTLSFDSAASLTNQESGPPEEPYVRAMIDVLTGYITDSPRQLAWTGVVSSGMLDSQNGAHALSPHDIAQRMDDLEFARRMVNEFCPKAHHIHLRSPNPNPHFYAFMLNHVMGGIAHPRTIASFSGPFKNERYMSLHEVKKIQRLLFKTAGFQPAYLEMGTPESNDEMYRNLTTGAAASLTRAHLTADKSHGDSRLRTEPTLLTAELLTPSTHPLAEVEATQVMAYAYDMAILSHYYSGQGTEGQIPDYARRYYAMPDPETYERNRIAMAVHGPFATIIDGNGQKALYSEYIVDYAAFLAYELDRLGIQTPPGEVETVTGWLVRSAELPTEWNLSHYMDPAHQDYGKGNLATHMIAELAVRVLPDGENMRFVDWKTMRKALKSGIYEQEVRDIIQQFSQQIHALYRLEDMV